MGEREEGSGRLWKRPRRGTIPSPPPCLESENFTLTRPSRLTVERRPPRSSTLESGGWVQRATRKSSTVLWEDLRQGSHTRGLQISNLALALWAGEPRPWGFYGSYITQALPIHPPARPPCRQGGGGTESSNPNHVFGSPSYQPHPAPRCFPKGPLQLTKDTFVPLITEEIPGVSEAVSQEPWTKARYIFLALNHSFTVQQVAP